MQYVFVEQTAHKSSDAEHDDGMYEDSSFALMNHSFDTISDVGCSSIVFEDECIISPLKRDGHKNIPLPDLSNDKNSEFSPIKLVYNSHTTTHGDPSIQLKHDSQTMHSKRVPNYPIVPSGRYTETIKNYRQSNPFYVLRSNRKAFENMKYLLPCLYSMDTCSVNMSDIGTIRHYKEKVPDESIVAADSTFAIRRVEAAICAFGGTINPIKIPNQHTRSIFRLNGEPSEKRRQYEKSLSRRYYMNGTRISWDVEDNPPIHVKTESEEHTARLEAHVTEKPISPSNGSRPILASSSPCSRSCSGESQSEATKMKYKCKKCGQLKQNHNCPYQEKLQRSIGCMVYPAANAYTAVEPGLLAAALTKMNNFVSYDSDHNSSQPEFASRNEMAPTQLPIDVDPYTGHPNTISPESLRGASFFHSPQSSLSAGSGEDVIPRSYPAGAVRETPSCNTTKTTGKSTLLGSKRPYENVPGSGANVSAGVPSRARLLPFMASFNLRSEHYRAATPQSNDDTREKLETTASTTTAYQYPSIHLTFGERKRLSDTLFFLSKEVPGMTTDCAIALHEARKYNEWDLAMAELLTQVVVSLYCAEGDTRLDGLHRYLLALGISC